MTHITYKTAKRLAEVLGDSAPDTMESQPVRWVDRDMEGKKCKSYLLYGYKDSGFIAYQLHDLLSLEFCEAMAKKHPHARYFNGKCKDLPWEINLCLNEAYYNGGMPAVETALMKMMDGK